MGITARKYFIKVKETLLEHLLNSQETTLISIPILASIYAALRMPIIRKITIRKSLTMLIQTIPSNLKKTIKTHKINKDIIKRYKPLE